MQKRTRQFRYDMVIFDVGGTLIGFHDRAPFQQFLIDVGLPATDEDARSLQFRLLSAISNSREKAKELGATDSQLQDWWQGNLARTWPTEPTLAEKMLSWLMEGRFDTRYEDVIPTFRGLQELGVGIGILSNWGTHLRAVLRRFELDRFAQFVIVSAEVGFAKPDRRIFQMAVTRAGTPAHRLLYVGDRYRDDIEGARNAGLDALLLDRGNHHSPTANTTIGDLRQVISHITSPSPSDQISEP